MLFEDAFDIRVFVGSFNKDTPRLKKLLNSVYYFFVKKVDIKPLKQYYIEPPYIYGFEYKLGLNRLNRLNHQTGIRSYLFYFKNFIYNDWKPDLIHAHNVNNAGIVAEQISKLFKVPYIITDHYHLNPNDPEYVKETVKSALIHSKINLFNSEWQYRTYLLLESKIKGKIIGNLIDENLFNINHNIEKSIFKIIHVSNGARAKDIGTLSTAINLFYKLLKSFEDIEIYFIGLHQDTQRIIIENTDDKINNKIKFIGRVLHNDLPKYYQESNVFLFSSLYETFGIAPLEAMMCGIPVITTNCGGVEEYIKPGINGLIVPLKDAEGLAGALFNVYSGKIKFDPLIVRNSVVSKFNKKKFYKRMLEIYKTL